MNKINIGNCEHFNECGNQAVYELETVEGKLIKVCEDCDEDYTVCNVCGKAVSLEGACFIHPEDEHMTCYYCQQKINSEEENGMSIERKCAIAIMERLDVNLKNEAWYEAEDDITSMIKELTNKYI